MAFIMISADYAYDRCVFNIKSMREKLNEIQEKFIKEALTSKTFGKGFFTSKHEEYISLEDAHLMWSEGLRCPKKIPYQLWHYLENKESVTSLIERLKKLKQAAENSMSVLQFTEGKIYIDTDEFNDMVNNPKKVRRLYEEG